MQSIIKIGKELLFPNRCPVCAEVTDSFGSKICPECRIIPRRVAAPHCIVCYKHVEHDGVMKCFDCKRKVHFFDRGVALYEYSSMHDSIFMYKNMGRVEYGTFYGDEIVKYLGDEIQRMHAQALIPIPLHPSKLNKRGYNQAKVLADEIGKRLGIEVRDDILKRVRKTDAQKKLEGFERQNNMKKAFHIYQNDVKLESIILIDDVYTTGSTIDAAAAEFRSIGVKEIYFLTLAIGTGK